MSKRWWVSYADSKTTKSLGVALTTHGDNPREAIEWLKEAGIEPACDEIDMAVIDGPAYMENLAFDVEWNKLPKDQLISKEEMQKMGYRSCKGYDIKHHPAVSIIGSDCT